MVLPVASVGSISSEPIAFVPKLSDKNVQVGVSSAVSVRQTPPPAAATYTRQLPLTHVGAMPKAVMRPDVMYSAPLKVKIAGSSAMLGPINCHVPTGTDGRLALVETEVAL